MTACSARFLAQYSFFRADMAARYSGVFWAALRALCSGELSVAASRALRCASATGSRIFSALFGCAARIPSIRLASNSASFPLRSPQLFILGLFFSASARLAKSSAEKFLGFPVRTLACFSRYSGFSHTAFSFARFSGFFAGLLSPMKRSFMSGAFIRAFACALAPALWMGWFGFFRASRNFCRCSAEGT